MKFKDIKYGLLDLLFGLVFMLFCVNLYISGLPGDNCIIVYILIFTLYLKGEYYERKCKIYEYTLKLIKKNK